jgi:hypothetical protein
MANVTTTHFLEVKAPLELILLQIIVSKNHINEV